MRRLLTPRWLALHALTLAAVVACLLLGRWQLGRAYGGNALSWGYAVQWPLFALFVAGMWVRAVRDATGAKPIKQPEPLRPRPPREPVAQPVARPVAQPEAESDQAEDDPQLTSYNRYLAWLAANPDRRPSEYPGMRPM